MLFERDYYTIAEPCKAVYNDRGSRFLSFAYPVRSKIEVKYLLDQLKTEYPDASHYCYATILNPDKSFQKLNDDGEPANTAARPILKQINALNLTNILVAVIRYFGGKKLGIPGLIDAYGKVANLCLFHSKVIAKTLLDYYKIESSFENEHLIFNLARKYSATVIESEHSQSASIILSINGINSDAFIKECQNLANFEVKYLKTE